MQEWRMDPDGPPERRSLQEPGRLHFVCELGALTAFPTSKERRLLSAASFFSASKHLFVRGGAAQLGAWKLSLSRYLDLIRYGPRSRRLEVARKDALVPFALDLMQQPFEVTGKSAQRVRRDIYERFTDLLQDDD